MLSPIIEESKTLACIIKNMKSIVEILHNDAASLTKTFGKGEIIQKPNSFNAHAIYVKKGLLRSYIIDSNGKEHIYMFAAENWIIGDIEAMEYHQPTALFIDCLEASEIIFFDNDILFKPNLDQSQIIENVKLLNRRIGRLQRRVLMLMGAPAADRYNYFLEIYPDLINRVPLKLIASFLGIAPQTLSTIRSKIARSE